MIRSVRRHRIRIMRNPRQSFQQAHDQLQGALQTLCTEDFYQQRQRVGLAIMGDSERT